LQYEGIVAIVAWTLIAIVDTYCNRWELLQYEGIIAMIGQSKISRNENSINMDNSIKVDTVNSPT
jgi:hypothetical protein